MSNNEKNVAQVKVEELVVVDSDHPEDDSAHTEDDSAHTETDSAHTETDSTHTEADSVHFYAALSACTTLHFTHIESALTRLPLLHRNSSRYAMLAGQLPYHYQNNVWQLY